MINIITTITILIMCHLLGDYVLQTRFIAETKGQYWYHMIVHCILYTFPFFVYFGFCWQLPILLITHIIIDAGKARYGKITYFQDQVLHYLTILIYLF